MGDRIQPGGRVDEQVYERFKKFVQRQHGQVRGALGEELEAAMEDRMAAVEGADRLSRIEDDLATVKAILADAESDGGSVADPATPEPPGHTHTADDDSDDADDVRPEHDPDDPPHPKTSTPTKLDWLEAEVASKATRKDDGGYVFAVPAVRKVVDDAWNHSDPDRAQALVDALVEDRLNAWVEDDGRMGWD